MLKTEIDELTERIAELRDNEFTVICCNPTFREGIRKAGTPELTSANPKIKSSKVNFYTASGQEEPWRVFCSQVEFQEHLKSIAAAAKAINSEVN